jgi:hypothetical protein
MKISLDGTIDGSVSVVLHANLSFPSVRESRRGEADRRMGMDARFRGHDERRESLGRTDVDSEHGDWTCESFQRDRIELLEGVHVLPVRDQPHGPLVYENLA